MSVDLELSILQGANHELGYVAGLAITDQLIIAAGGTSRRAPLVIASSNARHFEARKTPRQLGLRDVLAVGDALWTCGEYGQLAISRDSGASWKLLDTGTDACLFALALADDGAVWVVGDHGYAARVVGERAARVDFKTTARFGAVYATGGEIVVLGFDGMVYRWRPGIGEGAVAKIATGSTKLLTGLALSKLGTWIVVGDDGFIARSPDGTWFSRVRCEVESDLEAVAVCPNGTLVAVGDRGIILLSGDDGRHWTTVTTELTGHLWSVECFGTGVLIGGDDGLIAKLAPPGDDTWHDRINLFGGAKPLDVVFAGGPDGFIANGLRAYLDAIAEPDDDAEATLKQPHRRDRLAPLDQPGSAEDFALNYGMPLPLEAARLLAAVAHRDRSSSFATLQVDSDLLPDVGDDNLFELLVRRDQKEPLGTGLVEAFGGVFCIGSQAGGGAYHMELYEWDGPRQVLHYDHETQGFTGVFADSLDSMVYLSALELAGQRGKLSSEAFEIGLRKLRGKVAPTSQFSIGDGDPDFVALDPRRRDTEFFSYRARWICALLKNDDAGDIPRLFVADFNQVVPQDQLPARYEACEKFIPTALYSMWRAYLFDEPELAPYLEIGRRHQARLVRDAATLIDALLAGRTELGTITDVGGRLAMFRALDLDPRRTEHRRAHAEAGARLDANAGLTHQLELLRELRKLTEREREAAVQQLARELAPELEALLVGSLVRGDEPVLPGPTARSRAQAALAMTTRAIRLAPDDPDVQFTHAMLLLDAGQLDDLFAVLPQFDPANRLHIAVRMGKQGS